MHNDVFDMCRKRNDWWNYRIKKGVYNSTKSMLYLKCRAENIKYGGKYEKYILQEDNEIKGTFNDVCDVGITYNPRTYS